MKFITKSNLNHAVSKVKELFVEKEAGKGLSANDLSNPLKSNYDAAYSHTQEEHAPSEAQANVIESVKVNGTAQSIASKAVDIPVPTKTSQLTNDSNLQTASQVSGSITTALSSYTDTNGMNIAIASAVADASHLKRDIVASLPDVASADVNTVFMVAKAEGENDNIYDEYMVIDNKWEKIGDTEVDLIGYLHEDDLEEVTDAEIDAMFA